MFALSSSLVPNNNDINDNYISDIAPASPCLSATSSTFSVSLLKKSPNELIPMLKNAYSTIKDRENDLRLAAEIGKSLLENNMALKSNYEGLLNAPLPTPTNSYSLVEDDNKPSFTEEEYEKDLQFIPAHRTREALVELLEKENIDLSQQLESVLNQQKELDRNNTKKSRQLEAQIIFLQNSLDHATIKIQELEEYRKKKTLTKDGCANLTCNNNGTMKVQDETLGPKWLDEKNCCVKNLTKQYEELKLENEHVMKSKTEVEKKLSASLKDLRNLQQQFEEFQLSAHNHNQLKSAFEAQQLYIQELKIDLEEHRNTATKLRERGIHVSSLLDSSSSSIISDDDIHTQKIQDDNKKREDLLTELENAWFKHQSSPPRTRQTSAESTKASIFSPIQAIYNRMPNVDSALESIIVKAGVVEKDAIDDALSLIGHLENEYDHEKFLQEKRHIYYKDDYDFDDNYYLREARSQSAYYQDDDDQQICVRKNKETLILQQRPSGILGFAKNVFKSMISSTWRWFRFTIVMTVAVLLSMKEGPDSL